MKLKDLKNEVWKKIKLPSAHNSKIYYVSNRARIKSVDKSTKSEYLLKMKPDHHGHLRATIRLANGKNYGMWVHKHLAEHFVKKPSKKSTFIIHKNYKRDDNKLKNIVWVTNEEHKAYISQRLRAMGHVFHSKGGSAKLKPAQVAQIKKQLKSGRKTKTAIANKYDVSLTQLKRIERGENWANVKAAK